VDPEIEKGYEVKADLSVESLGLDVANRVMVVIAGASMRGVPAVRWNDPREKSIRLVLKVDGQERKSVPLQEFDPGMKLSKSGRQTLRYVSDLAVDREAEVTAVIDPDGRLVEGNTRNNRKAERLAPGQQRQRHKRGEAGSALSASDPAGPATGAENRPDLAVTRIWLNAARRVNVEIRNLGGPVPPELWQLSGADQPVLQLTQNGRSWAMAPLSAFDPQRLLSRGGASVVYVLDVPLNSPATVGAVIDATGRIDDRDRTNESGEQTRGLIYGGFAAATASQFLRINANVGIKTHTFGTSADGVLAVATGTAPSTSPADAFQLYSADIAAGNAAPHFRTENGAVIKLYQVVDADFANVPNSGDADTDDLIDKMRDALISHGLIASA